MYMFGVTYVKPTVAEAKRRDRIARKHNSKGAYIEVNRTKNAARGINHGEYQGWYTIPNMGSPFDASIAADILAEVHEEE